MRTPIGAIGRRRLLLGAGTTVAATLSGCLGGSDAPEPVTIGEVACANCGMIITEHPGPSGQAFYEETIPEAADDEPVFFCSSTCGYRFVFDQRERDRTPQVLYLTDYSTVEWDVTEMQGAQVISAHLDAADHTSAADLRLVVNSDVEGAMGPSMIPFSDVADAEAFTGEYGGDVISTEDVDRELLAALE